MTTRRNLRRVVAAGLLLGLASIGASQDFPPDDPSAWSKRPAVAAPAPGEPETDAETQADTHDAATATEEATPEPQTDLSAAVEAALEAPAALEAEAGGEEGRDISVDPVDQEPMELPPEPRDLASEPEPVPIVPEASWPGEEVEDPGIALDGQHLPGDPEAMGPAEPEGVIRPPDDPAEFGPPPPDPDANEFGVSPMTILNTRIEPGTRERLSWTTGQSFSGSVMETPVIVVHGIKPGPRLCLTGGVHGDELNGVEVVRRLAYKIDPAQLSGTVIAVPIVNLLGFSRGSRYLPDRRDLNRFFPGSPYGSSASRIAHSFFRAIIRNCDALVDFHTGSFDRANLPQVRGDLTIPAVVEFTRGFGATAVLHSPGALGMLRHAASGQGVPAVTFEIGGPLRLQPDEIEHGEQAIETLMHTMGMIESRRRWREPQAVFYESRWVRVDQGGMLFSEVTLGDRVRTGQTLGRVIDPVSNRAADVRAPEDGRVIGMALNQLVLPGFAAYHIGVAASEERVVNEAEQGTAVGDERFMEYDQLDEDSGTPRGPDRDEEEPSMEPPPSPIPDEER